MRSSASTTHRLTSAAAALAIGAGLAALAGCSGASSGDSGAADAATAGRSESEAGGGVAEEGMADDAAKVADGSVTTSGPAAVAPAVFDRKLARRADISVTVADVDVAAAKVRTIAAAADGLVTAEAISSEPDDPALGGFSTLTISVPTAKLDATLDRLAELGKVHSRNTSTDDVTAQYVDTESRVATMKASVERVRALMGQATKLADIVTLEAELSRRQADLEATQSQLAALADAVALAPVEVRLSTDEQVLEQAEPDTGFLAGLRAGWEAFSTSVTVLLTGLGAVLPFVVALLVIGIPLALWLRRRLPGGTTPATPATGAPPVS